MPVLAERQKGGPFYMRRMYGEPDKDAKAREHKHMTFKELQRLQKRHNLRKCGLHISAFICKTFRVMDTVTDKFENAKAGKDGMSVNLCFEDKLLT